MMDLFKSLNDMGKTIILVTHQMEHVLNYADRVLVFKDSELVYDSTPLKLFSNIDLVHSLHIDVPSVIELTHKIAKKYPQILNYEIKNVNDFVLAYKEVISL